MATKGKGCGLTANDQYSNVTSLLKRPTVCDQISIIWQDLAGNSKIHPLTPSLYCSGFCGDLNSKDKSGFRISSNMYFTCDKLHT